MSKYNVLWKHVKKNGNETIKLTFAEIQQIVGVPIDHFLKSKKELIEYGYQVAKFQ